MQLPCTAIILVHEQTAVWYQCLQSLQWAQAIIVVDNQSGLAEAALRDAGVTQILSEPKPITDFAVIRNQAMKRVNTPWCFFLDSDEVLEELSAEKILQLQALFRQSEIVGISLKRSDVFLKKVLSHGEAGDQSLIRFLRPEKARWQGHVHETPICDGALAHTNVQIRHYSHDSISSFISDVSGYAKMVARERQTTPVANLIQLLLFPPLKFVYNAFILGGLLDGWRGVTYASCMALHSLLVRVYWYEAHAQLVGSSAKRGLG